VNFEIYHTDNRQHAASITLLQMWLDTRMECTI